MYPSYLAKFMCSEPTRVTKQWTTNFKCEVPLFHHLTLTNSRITKNNKNDLVLLVAYTNSLHEFVLNNFTWNSEWYLLAAQKNAFGWFIPRNNVYNRKLVCFAKGKYRSWFWTHKLCHLSGIHLLTMIFFRMPNARNYERLRVPKA